VSPENGEDIILAQNPDLKLQEGDIQKKFIFKSKRNTRNLVVEVNSKTVPAKETEVIVDDM